MAGPTARAVGQRSRLRWRSKAGGCWFRRCAALSKDRNEWTADGRNFLNGLFKMLHTDGSHPGLSDEDHSTFRLHLALITGQALLRRLSNRT